MVDIIRDIIPSNRRPGHSMNPDYITIHQTGNTNAGADARMHSRFLKNNGPNPSWHYTVDDEVAVQHIPLNENGWHAADGGSGPGNRNSIGIEGCINSDGDYIEAVRNMAKLAAWLIKNNKVNKGYPEALKQHYDWNSTRNCPRQIRAGKDGINWDSFVRMVGEYLQTSGDSDNPSIQREIAVRMAGSDGEVDVPAYLIGNVTYIPASFAGTIPKSEVTGHGSYIKITPKKSEDLETVEELKEEIKDLESKIEEAKKALS